MVEIEVGSEPPPVHRTEAALLMAVLILAAVVRMWGLGTKSFWVDELMAVDRSRIIRQAIVDCKFGHEPPLRYILTHYLARLGPPELFTRLPAFIFGLATVGAFWLLARTLFGARVAIMAAFLLAISPWHIFHSQDVRMYAVMMFFWVLSLLFFFAVLEKPDRPLPWLGLALAHGINFYLSYVTLFVLGAEALTLVGVIVVRWRHARAIPVDAAEKPVERKPFNGKAFATGALIFAGFFGFTVSFWVHPFLGISDRYLGTSLVKAKPMITAVQGTRWIGWPAEFDLSFFVALFDRLLLPGRLWRWLAPFFCVVGLAIIWKRNRPLVWIAGLSFVLWMVTVLFSGMRHFVAPRYIFYLLIFSILATAVTLVTVGERLVASAGPGLRRPLAAFLIFLFLAASIVFAGPTVWLYMRCERQDWRHACEFLAQNVRKPRPAEISQNGDVIKKAEPGEIILTGPWGTHLAVSYYAPDELSSTTIRNCLTAESTEDEITWAKQGAWYITWGEQPEILKLVILSLLEPKATFPGLRGSIEIYRKREHAKKQEQ